jgi:hypothetical protein
MIGLAGALAGALFFLAVYGTAILDPTYIAWLLHGDPAQHYLGFAFFRQTPWFPESGQTTFSGTSGLTTSWVAYLPGFISSINPPSGTSVVFVDAIPLLAIPFKLASSHLPAEFQYFGLWMLACYVLQGFFSERILASFKLSVSPRLVGTLLLLTSPALALRAYGHEALMAHWLILASFDAWLARKPSLQGPWLMLASLIHPYFLAMLSPFALLAWWRQAYPWRHAAAWVGATVLAMLAAGYFVGSHSQLSAEGYGKYSANLLAFIDPMNWKEFLKANGRPIENAGEWSRLLPPMKQAAMEQYEGFAYLGAGVLALIALAALIPLAQRTFPFQPLQFGALWLPSLLLFAFALSTHVTLGSTTLADPKLPDSILHLLSIFRATGRFAWPLALLLPLWACARLSLCLSSRTTLIVLIAALTLQAVDLSGKWLEFHRRFEPGGVGQLPEYPGQAWQAARSAKHFLLLPERGDESGWIAPALFAARHGQTFNGFPLPRYSEETAQKADSAAIEKMKDGRLPPDTAWWIRNPSLAARLAPSLCAKAHCFPMPVGLMAVTNAARTGESGDATSRPDARQP